MVLLEVPGLWDLQDFRDSRGKLVGRERGEGQDCLDLQDLLETGDHLEISHRSSDHQDLRDRRETLAFRELME